MTNKIFKPMHFLVLLIILSLYCLEVIKANSSQLKNQDLKPINAVLSDQIRYLNRLRAKAIEDSKIKPESLSTILIESTAGKEANFSGDLQINGNPQEKEALIQEACIQKVPKEANIPKAPTSSNSPSAKDFIEAEKQKLKEEFFTTTKKEGLVQASTDTSETSNNTECPNSNISDNNIDTSNKANNEVSPPLTFKQSENKKLKKLKVNWYNSKLKAKDLGINSQGDLYAVSLDGKLYKYEFLIDTWDFMEGDFELTRINRVDVDWDGMPYVITDIGDTLFLGCDHKWTRLPGCATDIGIGRGGEVYKTGCDKRNNGYGIYRLHCNCPSNCCYKGCLNWRKLGKFNWSFKSDDRKCEWFRINGNGVKIDVAPSGNPYVIDINGVIYQYDGTNWRKVNTPALAFDLTISNEGILFFTGQDGKIYKQISETSPIWANLIGEADAVTAGPFSQPWVIRNSDKCVLGSAKFDYN